MNKVFLYGTIGFVKIHEKFLTFSLNARTTGSKENNYINCLLNGYKVKQFTDNLERGNKVTVEGQLQIREKDGKYYTTVLVDNLCSEKIRYDKPLEVVDMDKQNTFSINNTKIIASDEDIPF